MVRAKKTRNPHVWRPRNIVLGILALLLALLLALQFLLEPLVLRFANRKLDEIPGYKGRIEDVDIHLWRGAYTIEGLRLQKVEGDIPAPFFSASAVDFSIEWRALFQGKIVSEIYLDKPRLNFVVGPTQAQSQTKVDDWQDPVEELFPFTINRLEIRDGEIHFRDFHKTPKVDIHLDDLDALATGLTNAQENGAPLPASFKLTGRAMNHAPLRLDLKLAPLARKPTFDLNAEVKDLRLPALNDFFKAYAAVDAEGGTLSVFTEMTASDNRFKGYVKPLTKDLDILDLREDGSNPIQLAWEALVAGVGQLFENRGEDQFGTQIPFSGTFSDPNPEIWPTVGALLRNAFIRALNPAINNSIRYEGGGPGAKEIKAQKKKEAKKT